MIYLHAWFIAIILLALIVAFGLGHRCGHHEARNDPAHIDRMAHKDRRIAELEKSNDVIRLQRNECLRAYHALKKEKRAGAW